jgi:1,4-dihydroxy-2-naphthoate octaprenyltransferase
VFLLLAYAAIGIGVVTSVLPVWGLLGLATLPAAAAAFSRASAHAAGSGVDAEKLIPGLGMNVIVNILTPVLLAVGIFIG